MEMFENIISQYVDMGGNHIGLTPTIADTLTDPILDKRIEFLDESKIDHVAFFTNLIAFKDSLIQSLNNVKNTLVEITVSFVGFDRDNYKKYMGVDKFDRVWGNLKKLAELRDSNSNIKASVILRDYKGSDKKNVVSYLEKLELPYNVYDRFDTWGGLLEDDLKEEGSLKILKRRPRNGPCILTFKKPSISVDGDYKLCDCRDALGDLAVANIKDKSLQEIWNGKDLEEMRNRFYEPDSLPDVCKKCEMYKSIYDKQPWKNG